MGDTSSGIKILKKKKEKKNPIILIFEIQIEKNCSG